MMFAETIRVCLNKILKLSRLTNYLEEFRTTHLLVTFVGITKSRITVLLMLFFEGCFRSIFHVTGKLEKRKVLANFYGCNSLRKFVSVRLLGKQQSN